MGIIHNAGIPGGQTGPQDSTDSRRALTGMIRDAAPLLHRNRSSFQHSRSLTRKVSFTSFAGTETPNTNSVQGLGVLTSAVERYEKGIPSCLPTAFLLLGSPGSGKTALVCRLIMDCLERPGNLVPVLLPVADLVKRTCQDPDTIYDMDSAM